MGPLPRTASLDARILPSDAGRSATPYLIAIMTFAMVIVAAAGLALAHTAGSLASAIENRHVVQIPDGNERNLEAIVAAASSSPGVSEVRPVPRAQMEQLLERWLGPVGTTADLPVPALIHLELDRGANAVTIERRIRSIVPQARVVSERSAVGPVLRSVRALQWLSLALVLALAAAAAAAIVLATRAALDTHRATVEIMHGIGAADQQVASLFQRRIARDAAIGAIGGGIVALAVLGLVGSGAAMFGELLGRSPLGLIDLLILLALPVLAVAIATVVARFAVLGALRRSP